MCVKDSNVSVRGDSKPTMAEFVDRKTFRETVENLEKQIKDLGTQKSAAKAELEDTKDKIGSIKELKQEAKAFVTFHGYSKLLGTSSFFQKTLWLVCLPPLSGFCLYLVVNLYQQYLEFNVVTQLRIREEKNLTFPAVTICVQSHPSLETRDLKDVLFHCTIKVVQEETCTINDFFHYQVIIIIMWELRIPSLMYRVNEWLVFKLWKKYTGFNWNNYIYLRQRTWRILRKSPQFNTFYLNLNKIIFLTVM